LETSVFRAYASGVPAENAIALEHITLQKGELITSEIHTTSFVYVVAEGVAYAYTQLADGRRQILRHLFPGDVATVFSPKGSALRVTMRCLTPVRLCRFDAEPFRSALEDQEKFVSCLLRRLIEENTKLDQRLVELGALTSEEAEARFILDYYQRMRGTDAGDGEVHFPFRLIDIADTVGVTEVHAGRLMRKLEEVGAIDRRLSSQLYVSPERLMHVLHPQRQPKLMSFAG
jgi:CRP-like cAMP-binding protein